MADDTAGEEAGHVLEKVMIEEDEEDDDFQYEEVQIDGPGGGGVGVGVDDDDDEDDDLATIAARARQPKLFGTASSKPSVEPAVATTTATKVPSATTTTAETRAGTVEKRRERVDDFIRNYLVALGFGKTMEAFQTEWYDHAVKRQFKDHPQDSAQIDDAYAENAEMRRQLTAVEKELEEIKAKLKTSEEQATRLQKERDYHRLHHKRVAQEKAKLAEDSAKLAKKAEERDPEIAELKKRVEQTHKELTATRVERDSLLKKLGPQPTTLTAPTVASIASSSSSSPTTSGNRQAGGSSSGLTTTQLVKKSTQDTPKKSALKTSKSPSKPEAATSNKAKLPNVSEMPEASRQNPWCDASFVPVPVDPLTLQNTRVITAHSAPISSVCVHPRRPIIVTTSDDCTWRMFRHPEGDLLMTGDGHRDWVADACFHPAGTHLATASGDTTVKLWDFSKEACTATFTEHTQAVWGVSFHDSGDFLATASMDHTCKLLDLNTLKCRQALRGHLDSVNSIQFQPYTNHVATCSADKTVSVWDIRVAECFPSECTRVLTNHGFLFLDEIERKIHDKENVLYAAYDLDSNGIVYVSGELIYPNDGLEVEQDIIEFTDKRGRTSDWGEGSPAQMDTKGRGAGHTNHVSLLVTPMHEVYVQKGNKDKNGLFKLAMNQQGKGYPFPPAKFRAEDLLYNPGVDSATAAVRFTASAPNGTTGDMAALDKALMAKGLTFMTADKRKAFVELYFFWVGDGSLSHCNHTVYVTFSNTKPSDIKWLKETFSRLGLAETGQEKGAGGWSEDKDETSSDDDDDYDDNVSKKKTQCLRIKDATLVAFFENEYGRKYAGGLDYKPSVKWLKSTKWLMDWVWLLGKDLLVPALEALRRADGSMTGSPCIYTSSVQLRDDLTRLMIHAGYTTHFLHYREKGDELIIKNPRSGKMTTAHAKADGWVVYYSAERTHPDIDRNGEITRTKMLTKTWCITIDHKDHLIFAQRAERDVDTGLVTKASRPVIVGQCLKTFFGHNASCNNVCFNLKGDTLVSTDTDGEVKVWDLRTVKQRLSIPCGPYSASKATFDHTGNILFVASDDGSVKVHDLIKNQQITELRAHEDAVHALTFISPYSVQSLGGPVLFTAGSDGTLRSWSVPL